MKAYEGEGWEGLASNVTTFRRTFDVIWNRGFLFTLLWSIVRVGLDWSGRWPSFVSFRSVFFCFLGGSSLPPHVVRTCVNFLSSDRNLSLWYLDSVS